jgi:taurine--2-oxoglutarate transaminase
MPNTRQDSSAVPPCAVTDHEVAEGLRILDAAIEVADQHVR